MLNGGISNLLGLKIECFRKIFKSFLLYINHNQIKESVVNGKC